MEREEPGDDGMTGSGLRAQGSGLREEHSDPNRATKICVLLPEP